LGQLFAELSWLTIGMAAGVTFAAAFIKGAVGFGMPTIMISGIGSFLSVEAALAILIVPTVLTNAAQALREGWRAAWESIIRYRKFLLVGFVFLVLSAQLVLFLPSQVLFLLIGISISLFAFSQLIGWRLHLRPDQRDRAEPIVGAVAGFVGGLSGVWGPPTVAYLTAIDAPKREQVRVQGVIYGLGAIALMLAHIRTGIVTVETVPLSTTMLIPAFIGLWFGFQVQDRLDQEKFRRATLFVLVIAGLNLIRRGIMS